MSAHRKTYFTLVEVVIAVTIFTMVALSLFFFSSSVTSAWGRTVRHRNDLNELITLDRVFGNVLPNIIPFTWKNAADDNEITPFIVAEPDRLRCAYRHRLNDADEGAIRFAEIYLEDGAVYMGYTDRPFFDWNEVSNRTDVSKLTENVKDLHFLYVDWSDDTDADWGQRIVWLEEWETEDSGREDVPLAVVLSITWNDGTQENWMYRTMGNGYRERLGKWEPLGDNESRKL